MNNLLDLGDTLQALDELAAHIRDGRARADRLKTELDRLSNRLQQQQRQAAREAQDRLNVTLAEAEARRGDQGQALESRHARRQTRLAEARRNTAAQRLKAVGDDESREVFRIQRDLLQVQRDCDQGRQRTDATLADFLKDWEQEREQVDRLDWAITKAFRGYRAFLRLLNSPAQLPAPLPSTDPPRLLEESSSQRHEAQVILSRFRRSPLPLIFSLISPWLLVGLLAALHALAVVLLPLLTERTLAWDHAALSLGATAIIILVLHAIGLQLDRNRAHLLAATILRSRALLEAAHQAAHTVHHLERERLGTEAKIRTESLEAAWRRTVADAESRRAALQQGIEQRWNAANARNESRLATTRAGIDRQHARVVEDLQARIKNEVAEMEAKHSGQHRHAVDHLDKEWRLLAADWQGEVRSRYENLAQAATAADRLFPSWADPHWDRWTPPETILHTTPFARLQVDLDVFAGGLPADPRLALPGPSRLELPLLLSVPSRSSLLLTTRDAGREMAIASLNNVVVRLLLSAPPGRALFTILDPVGLGESFAGLMHLTDHEDRLINRRIWTQPDHIEQRLADLNEHVEKVTQLYLRNEYRTIAEYNAQAGRIAEPYHFVVIADFPVNFSDLAVRRLLSLANSGPRCGVFTLVHWDTRRPAPLEFVPDDLRRAGIDLEARGGKFAFANRPADGLSLILESPPPPGRMTALLQQVGRSSIDSNRVELPFAQIAPDDSETWTRETAQEVRVAVGMTGATKLQHLVLGKGTRQHALIAGKTGSGKSTLFHILITNLSLWASPQHVEFYLVDFKKGVEFKCYAQHRLPHARVVAIESDREFGLSVLQRVDEELHRRGDLFRKLSVQDLTAYQRVSGRVLPRTLVIIDEFQEFFTEDDRISQQAALLLDRLVRQGRAFGIHVLLGSQTLGGAYTLARTTLGQMVIRIALQCSQADALLIMDDDNPAPRLLSRPGEAIYNDAAGAIEGNSPFQVAWLPEQEREIWLDKIRQHAANRSEPPSDMVVFEGNAAAEVRENPLLEQLILTGPAQPVPPARIWLGAPNSIKGPTEVVFHRQNGHNLLVVGQHDEAALAIIGLSLIALAAQHPPGSVRLILCDVSPPSTPHRVALESIVAAIPHPVTVVGSANLERAFEELTAELAERSEHGADSSTPSVFLCIHHLQRFKTLRYEDDFALNLDDAAAQAPGAVLNRILTEGTHLGLHVLCTTDSYNNAGRFLSRKALNEFELRVLFQMSAGDSASLMDDPKASTLGMHRAVLFNSQEGTMETFRPYAVPDAGWVEQVGRRLSRQAEQTAL